ncbi:MAG: hypothetical protein L6N96_04190, partial [Candidatus Methylarchaceae archaeon HK02M2]|nr:hypothetical protein [Candidatus Methylarchaceae archaeon HK02M2]
YVTGTGYDPSTSYDIYVVEDVTTWTDGMSIPSRVADTATSIMSNTGGTLDPTLVWSNPQTVGMFDVVVDLNENGYYDEGVDVLDDDDIEVTAGFVIPEFSPFLLLPLFIGFTLFATILRRRIR